MKRDFEKLFLQVFCPFLSQHGFVKKTIKNVPNRNREEYYVFDESSQLLRRISWRFFSAFDRGLYDMEIAVSSLSSFDEDNQIFHSCSPEFHIHDLRIFSDYHHKQVNVRRNDLAFQFFKDNPERTTLGLEVVFEIMMEYKSFLFAKSVSDYVKEYNQIYPQKFGLYNYRLAFNDAILMNDIPMAISLLDEQIVRQKKWIEDCQQELLLTNSKHFTQESTNLERRQGWLSEDILRRDQLLRGEYSHFQEKVQENHQLCLKWIDEVLKPTKMKR